MISIMDLKSAYLSLLQNLLPQGQAWNREPNSVMSRLLNVAADGFAYVHERALKLLEEADPRTAIELIDEWEFDHGLPDSCTGENDSLQERRNSLIQKIISTGGQSKSYFVGLATALGYEVETTEFRPFVCGMSQCGVGQTPDTDGFIEIGITDDADIRFFWRILVLEPRVTWFRAGESQVGVDPLARIARANDLECILLRLKPAHTELIFAYEGI